MNRSPTEKLIWSQFCEDENEYRGPHGNALSEGEFLKILNQSREFREALGDSRPSNPVGM